VNYDQVFSTVNSLFTFSLTNCKRFIFCLHSVLWIVEPKIFSAGFSLVSIYFVNTILIQAQMLIAIPEGPELNGLFLKRNYIQIRPLILAL
jgi:hypothetical protein